MITEVEGGTPQENIGSMTSMCHLPLRLDPDVGDLHHLSAFDAVVGAARQCQQGHHQGKQ